MAFYTFFDHPILFLPALLLGTIAGFLLLLGLVRRFLLSFRSPIQTPPYLLQFPPSRRHVLARLPQFEKWALQPEIPLSVLSSQAIPTTVTPDLSKDNQYTPTGFATQEIRALGRFPNYALLSGVPNPEPVSPMWDISKALFRPFRPFRWNYHQHMALMKYSPDWWVELERNYVPTMRVRQQLLAQHGSRILFQSAGAELAVRELAEMLLQFLAARYPAHFSLSASSASASDNALFHNRLLGTTTNLAITPPLRAIFANIPEDYALMLRSESDGLYYLRAAAVCSSVGWHVAQHRDAPLRSIHADVPGAGRMAMSMDRWFAKVATDAPVMRCSWSLEDGEVLFASPEAEAEEGREWRRGRFVGGREDELGVEDIRLRCDAQTLRRLPISGAVAFNFKATFTRLEELRDEAFVPALLHKVLTEGKGEMVEYKVEKHVKKVAVKALEEWAAEQVEDGLVPADWEVGTLDESPFFPGWEEKWRRQQQGLE
ncbi:Putative alpha-mannosyltransferase [Madurella fahalii]|uniref:Alpha-mannosyltransferase n=1 Tax=Madurella fahalii TaxID=1157608 RepID=A0ABQ0GTD0_9PEZI